ncbi:MAG: hypothetical protein ACLFNI_12160, partial [Natronomonas sp.]
MSSPDELPELEGIDASDEFRRYVAELRQTWVPTDERAFSLAETENNPSTEMSTEPSTDCTDCASFTRRGFMRAGATAAVTAATVGAGAGNVAAVDGLDVAGDYVQAPYISGTVTAATHESDFAPLDYVDDSGEQASLEEMGAQIAEREDDETPHNPITLEAANFDADDYSAFPRDETYENADGDEEAVTALDETHWSVDEADTSGSITVEDETSPADGPG